MTSVRRLGVALLAAGVAAAGCTGGDGPAAAGPAATPTPARTIEWTECRLPVTPGALVRAVAAGSERVPWTAVGQEGGVGGQAVRPAVWTSADGCAWRRAKVVPVTPDGERTGFSAVARRGSVVVAQGRAYSQVHGNIRPTLWRAEADGALTEVELLREVFGGEGGISVDALVSTPDEFLATGAYVARSKFVAAQVWRSRDGDRWTKLPPGPDQTSTATEQFLPRDLATGPGGTLVVGTAFQVRGGAGFDGAAWYALAGAEQWRRVDLGASGLVGDGDQRLLADTAFGRGFVAVGAVRGADGFRLRAAVSGNGTAWTAGGELPGPLLPGGGRPMADLAPAPRGGVVAAAVGTGGAALWVSKDGRAWAPEVVPGDAAGATAVVLGPGADRLVLVVQTPTGPRVHLGR